MANTRDEMLQALEAEMRGSTADGVLFLQAVAERSGLNLSYFSAVHQHPHHHRPHYRRPVGGRDAPHHRRRHRPDQPARARWLCAARQGPGRRPPGRRRARCRGTQARRRRDLRLAGQGDHGCPDRRLRRSGARRRPRLHAEVQCLDPRRAGWAPGRIDRRRGRRACQLARTGDQRQAGLHQRRLQAHTPRRIRHGRPLPGRLRWLAPEDRGQRRRRQRPLQPPLQALRLARFPRGVHADVAVPWGSTSGAGRPSSTPISAC